MTEATDKKRITITFSTTQEIKDWVENSANQDERTVSVFLNRLVRNSFKQTVGTSKQT